MRNILRVACLFAVWLIGSGKYKLLQQFAETHLWGQ